MEYKWELLKPSRLAKEMRTARVSGKGGAIRFSSGCADLFGEADRATLMIDKANGRGGLKLGRGPGSAKIVKNMGGRIVASVAMVRELGMQANTPYPVTIDSDGIIVITVGVPSHA